MIIKGIAKKWRFPDSSEKQLSVMLQSGVRDLVKRLRDRTRAMKFDATSEEINTAESDAESLADQLISAIVAALPALALQIYRFNRKQWILVAISAGGKDNLSIRLLQTLGDNYRESWEDELQRQWEDMAEQSVRKMFDNIIADWSSKIRQGNFSSQTDAQVREMAEQRFVVYRGWAKNRASGIVGAWNSRLMRQRLQDAGVTHYFWRGIMDDRERPKHVSWEGKRISLDDIHPFPGEEYGCRCWAVPDFSTNQEN